MTKPLPETLRINFTDGQAIMASIRRNRRASRLVMRLEPDGAVVISVPWGTRLPEIEGFAQGAAPRLQKALARHPAEKAAIPVFVDVPLLDKRLPVRRVQVSRPTANPVDKGESSVSMAGDEIIASGDDEGCVMLCLQNFFLKFAAAPLAGYIRKETPASVQFATTVRNQRKRMGSCSHKIQAGAIPHVSLNWRAILLPVPLLRHLCMHEIAHIGHMNHGEDFYARLEKLSPMARQKEKALNEAWRALPPWVFYRR